MKLTADQYCYLYFRTYEEPAMFNHPTEPPSYSSAFVSLRNFQSLLLINNAMKLVFANYSGSRTLITNCTRLSTCCDGVGTSTCCDGVIMAWKEFASLQWRAGREGIYGAPCRA